MNKIILSRKYCVLILVVLAIVGRCVIWQFLNSKVVGAVVEQKVQTILKSEFSLDFTNWHTVNASGGLVGSPFCSIRWWREYYLQKEGDFAAFEALSNSLGGKHWTTGFAFLPLGYGEPILPHHNSVNLANWWQPETNPEAMMSAEINDDKGRIIHIYGIKKTTNALVYVQIIDGN